MAAENPAWGAPRIHGEIQKLGLEISERTVSRYMPRRPAHPDERQRWRTFFANHREVIAAIDFFTVPTVTFRALYVDHVIVLNERHLQRLLAGFVSYYLNDRTHLSLKKDAPAMRAVESKPHPAAEVVALPRLGGLHHRYAWRCAA